MPKLLCRALFSGLLLLLPTVCGAENAYLEMRLEDLMNISVTSVSKRTQSLRETAAAVYVLTQEDIRRSGATSIPEALRMVPGFMVGQNNSHVWSISSRGRGFNPTFENKLLVMIDGRSVYTPVFGGVFWESIDILMEDIDRIEVVRGPGSSAWGTNAVNGVVNVITKNASETQGLLLSALYGTAEHGTTALRYGDRFGQDQTYRLFAKYRHLDGFDDLDGEDIHDGLEGTTFGARTDLAPDAHSTLTLQGDVTQNTSRRSLVYPDLRRAAMVNPDSDTDFLNANLLAGYRRELSETSSISLQSFFSHDTLDSPVYDVRMDTYDLDIQYQFAPLENHTAQLGLGFRTVHLTSDDSDEAVAFSRGERTDHLFSAFVEDEIAFDDGRWILTIGSKFEHNGQTGLEIMPNARLLRHATDKHAFWGAVSRSVRTPSVAEQDVAYNLGLSFAAIGPDTTLPVRFSAVGNENLNAESAIIWEIGHRFSPNQDFLLETTLFLTQADNLLSETYDPSALSFASEPIPHLQLDAKANNDVLGNTYGLEINTVWKPLDRLTLYAWYTYFEDSYSYRGRSSDLFADTYGRISPRHQFFFRSAVTLPHDLEFDISTRYVSELPGLHIPDYGTVDMRLGWRPTDHIELSLVGKNLLDSRHQEAAAGLVYGSSAAIERSVFLKLRMDF